MNIRLEAPSFSEVVLGQDARLTVSGFDGVVFHHVLTGQCRLRGGGAAYDMSTGQYALIRGWRDYSIETGTPDHSLDILDVVVSQGQPVWSPLDGTDRPILIRAGREPIETRMLTGLFRLRDSRALMLVAQMPEFLKLDPASTPLGAWLDASLRLMTSESERPQPGFAGIVSQALELLLAQSLRSWIARPDQPPGLGRGLLNPKIRRVLEAIHENAGRSWTLDELAKVSGQSRSAFARVFVEVMGETPFSYLTSWRMTMAAEQLASSTTSIAALAEGLGYPSGDTFARAFRVRYGISPRAYRRRMQTPPL